MRPGAASAAGGSIKVCGLRDPAAAEVAAEAGATAVGLVFDPASPRWVDLKTARSVVLAVGDRVDCVGVFVDAGAGELNRVADQVGLHALQLHCRRGTVDPALVARVDRPLIPAFRLRTASDPLEPLIAWWPGELVLVDAGTPDRPGGTGERADWPRAHAVARHRPLWLAGGLGPSTVAEAIRAVGPAGVDASTRLELAPGVKDPERVRAFAAAARLAFEAARAPAATAGGRP